MFAGCYNYELIIQFVGVSVGDVRGRKVGRSWTQKRDRKLVKTCLLIGKKQETQGKGKGTSNLKKPGILDK